MQLIKRKEKILSNLETKKRKKIINTISRGISNFKRKWYSKNVSNYL